MTIITRLKAKYTQPGRLSRDVLLILLSITEIVIREAQKMVSSRQPLMKPGSFHFSLGRSRRAYCNTKGRPNKSVSHITKARAEFERRSIYIATQRIWNRFIVITQKLKNNKVPHCRMNPSFSSLKPRTRHVTRLITVALSRLARVLPERKRKSNQGRNPSSKPPSSFKSGRILSGDFIIQVF